MTAETKPPMTLTLHWEGDLRFSGRSGDASLVLDSKGQAGVSPTQALAFGLAGCMGIDVVNILLRGRHPLKGLAARLEARRADGQPARFTAFDLHFVLTGDVPTDAIDRAVQLSRDKYCSVWHSLRQDIDLQVTYERSQAR
jgi:putative redox protein